MGAKLTFLEIGKRLKKAREDSGFTQTEVEELIGINRVTVSQIENGKKKIDSLLLKKLADLYGYSIMYFLEKPEDYQELTIAFRADNLTEEEKENVNWAKRILFNYEDLKKIKEEE